LEVSDSLGAGCGDGWVKRVWVMQGGGDGGAERGVVQGGRGMRGV